MKELIVSPVYNAKGNIVGQEYHGELIRCKDCVYCQGNICKLYIVETHEVNGDDFCSEAERKDHETRDSD